MNEIYVIGHHNPDTDSIVSAMAYAALRNALGDRNYVAAHMDHISDQTQRMLDRFGFQPPRTVQNVRTQVEDLDYDTPPALNATVTMDRAGTSCGNRRSPPSPSSTRTAPCTALCPPATSPPTA